METIAVETGPKRGDERGPHTVTEGECCMVVTQDAAERFCAACGRWGTPSGLLAIVFGVCPTCGLPYHSAFGIEIEVEHDRVEITMRGHKAVAEYDPGDGWGGACLFRECTCSSGKSCDLADVAEAALSARNCSYAREHGITL